MPPVPIHLAKVTPGCRTLPKQTCILKLLYFASIKHETFNINILILLSFYLVKIQLPTGNNLVRNNRELLLFSVVQQVTISIVVLSIFQQVEVNFFSGLHPISHQRTCLFRILNLIKRRFSAWLGTINFMLWYLTCTM